MSFFARLFGLRRTPAGGPASSPHSQLATVQSAIASPTQSAARRELLRVVLRDTMMRHGIPGAWMNSEVLASTSRNGAARGVHWRLVIVHWDPRLLQHGVAFQQSLIKRVTTFDPMVSGWLTGISWQFALPDESVCPAMPHPGLWTTDPNGAPPAPPRVVIGGGTGDVIAGPVRIADTSARPAKAAPETARADLEQLLAARDADFARPKGQPGLDVTQRIWLGTEPAPL